MSTPPPAAINSASQHQSNNVKLKHPLCYLGIKISKFTSILLKSFTGDEVEIGSLSFLGILSPLMKRLSRIPFYGKVTQKGGQVNFRATNAFHAAALKGRPETFKIIL